MGAEEETGEQKEAGDLLNHFKIQTLFLPLVVLGYINFESICKIHVRCRR